MNSDTTYPFGSEWRKWDLHVHTPLTKLSNSYQGSSDMPDWDRFCQIINESDVTAFGITDYFILDSFFAFKKEYVERYPECRKAFFPNLELRLTENLSKDGESVNIHVMFRPDLDEETASRFLNNLSTEVKVEGQRALRCSELKASQLEKASVTRKSLEDAIAETFGAKSTRSDFVLVICSCKSDGIRAGGKSIKRKQNIADEIDKLSDGFFGNSGSVDYFLDVDRYEDAVKAIPKPVFAGCDAHSYEELGRCLGRYSEQNNLLRSEITWIKADPTFEGLQQTLIDPAHRIAISQRKPDEKEPYKFIRKIKFLGTPKFPGEVCFNSNLCSVIGSRSSGKSALLAYVAYTVDKEYTISCQVKASGLSSKEVGPGAGLTWDAVRDIQTQIEWGAPDTTQGKVIYIPQNSLYKISEQPSEITAKIRPALFHHHPSYKQYHEMTLNDVESANDNIRLLVSAWFRVNQAIQDRKKSIEDLGDKKAVEKRKEDLNAEIIKATEEMKVDEIEMTEYQKVVEAINSNGARVKEIETEEGQLESYVEQSQETSQFVARDGAVQIDVTSRSLLSNVPSALGIRVTTILSEAKNKIKSEVSDEIAKYRNALAKEIGDVRSAMVKLKNDNADLISKFEAKEALENLIKDRNAQQSKLDEFKVEEDALAADIKTNTETTESICTSIEDRGTLLDELKKKFSDSVSELENLTFELELGIDPSRIEQISEKFNKKERGDYCGSDKPIIDYSKAQKDPAEFLKKMADGTQKLNQGHGEEDTATEVLSLVPEIRFSATIEGDRIGGFSKSSMTPGKQALFALTLILNESNDTWPLLIDQPEDDLDSRSVYDSIVPYLLKRKKERQIIMVSHNANLVIGADSEQVIVANRHGDDRKNRDSILFAYLSGSLEQTADIRETEFTLESGGIREHACEILDGGREAFEKRRHKYKI